MGFIENLLSDKNVDHRSRQRFLNIMDEEAKRMNRLIDDILSLSKVETEEHITPSTSLSIIDSIKSVISSLEERGLSKNNKISLINKSQYPSKPIYIIGDYDDINQVFSNLLENAIKYGYKNSEIILKIFFTFIDFNLLEYSLLKFCWFISKKIFCFNMWKYLILIKSQNLFTYYKKF